MARAKARPIFVTARDFAPKPQRLGLSPGPGRMEQAQVKKTKCSEKQSKLSSKYGGNRAVLLL
jgi:hypothetical protein